MNRNGRYIDYYVYTDDDKGGYGVSHGFLFPGKTWTMVTVPDPLGHSIGFDWRYRGDVGDFNVATTDIPDWIGAGDEVNVYIILLDNEEVVFKFKSRKNYDWMKDKTTQLYEAPLIKEPIPEPVE